MTVVEFSSLEHPKFVSILVLSSKENHNIRVSFHPPIFFFEKPLTVRWASEASAIYCRKVKTSGHNYLLFHLELIKVTVFQIFCKKQDCVIFVSGFSCKKFWVPPAWISKTVSLLLTLVVSCRNTFLVAKYCFQIESDIKNK